MASNPSSDLQLTPLRGRGFPLSGWLVQYQLLLAVLDPFTHEAAWILPTAARVLGTFEQADCRVAFVMAGADAEESRQFLGPHARSILTFPDPTKAIVRGFALDRLPALVHVANDATVVNSAEGWDPDSWQKVTDVLAMMMRWTGPVLPYPADPAPFAGTPAR